MFHLRELQMDDNAAIDRGQKGEHAKQKKKARSRQEV